MKVTTKFGRALVKGAGLVGGAMACAAIWEGVNRLVTDDDDYEYEDTEEEDEESFRLLSFS